MEITSDMSISIKERLSFDLIILGLLNLYLKSLELFPIFTALHSQEFYLNVYPTVHI
jgi:hypothetical protein